MIWCGRWTVADCSCSCVKHSFTSCCQSLVVAVLVSATGVIKSLACYVSWPEVVKGVPNQALVCFVRYGMCSSVCLSVHDVCGDFSLLLVLRTHLQNDLLSVKWNAKPYSLTLSFLGPLGYYTVSQKKACHYFFNTVYSMTENTWFPGFIFMFPQIVQRH